MLSVAINYLVLFVLFVSCRPGHGACLPDAIPDEQRKEISIDGQSVPLGIWSLNWDSATLYSWVFRIFASEKLGFRIPDLPQYGSTYNSLWAMAGCAEGHHPDNVNAPADSCILALENGGARSTTHLLFETWELYLPTIMARMKARFPKRLPKNLGLVGYEGVESFFVPGKIAQQAMEQVGLGLDIYRSFNASWHQPSLFFDSVATVNAVVENLSISWSPCHDLTPTTDVYSLEKYAERYGDADGVEYVNGNLQAKCINGTWWASPSCRSNLDDCVPVLSSQGWGYPALMQKVAAFNMPIAIASLGYSDWVTVVRATKTISFWWIPGVEFIDMDMRRMVFPFYNDAEYDIGVLTSDSVGIKLEKWAHPELEEAAPIVYSTATNMRVSMDDMKAMLLHLFQEKKNKSYHVAAQSVACEFLRRTNYEAWIPDRTDCPKHWGLIDFGGDFVSTRDDALSCDWCRPGRYSIMFEDARGQTRWCKTCGTGTATSIIGALNCQACPAGKYAAMEGQTKCGICPLGAYSEETSSTTCDTCEAGTYAAGEGMSKCLDCVPGTYSADKGSSTCKHCERGNYTELTASSACITCGTGGLTTPSSGTASAWLCGCPKGRYLPMPLGHNAASTFKALANGTNGCEECPWGMECPGLFPGAESEDVANVIEGQHRQPLTKKRYFATADAPYSAFLCKKSKWCPGSKVAGQTCAENRKYFGCGSCKSHYIELKNGNCRKCGPADPLFFICTSTCLILILPWVIYLSYDVDLTHSTQSPKHVALSSGHIILYFLEACAIMSDMNIEWPWPVKDMLASASIFAFEFDALKPACAMASSYSFEMKYLSAVCFPLFLALYLSSSLLVSKAIEALFRCRFQGLRLERTVSCFGIIYIGLYVATCRSTVRLFECFQVNPDGRRQLSAFSYVECFSERWWAMFPVGVFVCLLYGVATMGFAVYLCRVAPKRFINNDATFCKCFGFLFHEFRRDCWWWLPFVMLRNLLLPMALVISPGDGQSQSTILFTINLAYLLGVLSFWPWLTEAVNRLDTCTMGVGFLTIISLTSSFLDETMQGPSKGIIAFLMTSILGGSMLLLGTIYVGNMVQHFAGKMNCDTSKLPCMKKLDSSTSNLDLARVLLEVSSMLEETNEEELSHRIGHLNATDRKSAEHFSTMALAELLHSKFALPGLPARLVMGKTLEFGLKDQELAPEHQGTKMITQNNLRMRNSRDKDESQTCSTDQHPAVVVSTEALDFIATDTAKTHASTTTHSVAFEVDFVATETTRTLASTTTCCVTFEADPATSAAIGGDVPQTNSPQKPVCHVHFEHFDDTRDQYGDDQYDTTLPMETSEDPLEIIRPTVRVNM